LVLRPTVETQDIAGKLRKQKKRSGLSGTLLYSDWNKKRNRSRLAARRREFCSKIAEIGSTGT
jgi:hypothetical protein